MCIRDSGDTHLGGDDFDQKIVDWMVAEFKKNEGIDLSNDRMAMHPPGCAISAPFNWAM